MKLADNLKIGILAVAVGLGTVAKSEAQSQTATLANTVTETQLLRVGKANNFAGQNQETITKVGAIRKRTADGIPHVRVGQRSRAPHLY